MITNLLKVSSTLERVRLLLLVHLQMLKNNIGVFQAFGDIYAKLDMK